MIENVGSEVEDQEAGAASAVARLSEISAVVPVYRSADGLVELYRRLTASLDTLAERHEIILVEDGGLDGSWEVIEALAAQDRRVRGVRMSRNYGQHNALLAGIRAVQYDITVTLDDDLQNPPEEIGKLIAALDDSIDVVYGTPANEQHGFLRDQASRITKLALQSAMGADTARHVSPFRAFRTTSDRSIALLNALLMAGELKAGVFGFSAMTY